MVFVSVVVTGLFKGDDASGGNNENKGQNNQMFFVFKFLSKKKNLKKKFTFSQKVFIR